MHVEIFKFPNSFPKLLLSLLLKKLLEIVWITKASRVVEIFLSDSRNLTFRFDWNAKRSGNGRRKFFERNLRASRCQTRGSWRIDDFVSRNIELVVIMPSWNFSILDRKKKKKRKNYARKPREAERNSHVHVCMHIPTRDDNTRERKHELWNLSPRFARVTFFRLFPLLWYRWLAKRARKYVLVFYFSILRSPFAAPPFLPCLFPLPFSPLASSTFSLSPLLFPNRATRQDLYIYLPYSDLFHRSTRPQLHGHLSSFFFPLSSLLCFPPFSLTQAANVSAKTRARRTGFMKTVPIARGNSRNETGFAAASKENQAALLWR
mgnify:CR=1 FL=1